MLRIFLSSSFLQSKTLAQELFLYHSIKTYMRVQFWEYKGIIRFLAKLEDKCPEYYAINFMITYVINYPETPHFLGLERLDNSRNVVMLSPSFAIWRWLYICISIWACTWKMLETLGLFHTDQAPLLLMAASKGSGLYVSRFLMPKALLKLLNSISQGSWCAAILLPFYSLVPLLEIA